MWQRVELEFKNWTRAHNSRLVSSTQLGKWVRVMKSNSNHKSRVESSSRASSTSDILVPWPWDIDWKNCNSGVLCILCIKYGWDKLKFFFGTYAWLCGQKNLHWKEHHQSGKQCDSDQNTNSETRVNLIEMLFSEIPTQEWFSRLWWLQEANHVWCLEQVFVNHNPSQLLWFHHTAVGCVPTIIKSQPHYTRPPASKK